MTNYDFDAATFVFYNDKDNKIALISYNKAIKMYEVEICGVSGTKMLGLMGLTRMWNLIQTTGWTQVGII
jgi:hypothetical protein